MKKYIMLTCILLLVPLYGCTSDTQKALNNGFFIWMDGYCAAGLGEKNSVALSFYYDSKYETITDKDIVSIAFEDISQDVQISNFRVEDLEISDHTYQGFSLTMDLDFHKKGLYKTDRLLIDLKNNQHCSLPIGNFTFDIGAPADETLLDTWSSPVATSNADNFAYDFKLVEDSTRINSITYAENKNIQDSNGINSSGSIILSEAYHSPIKYIKPKIELISQNHTQIVYSKIGCYCGAIDFSDHIIEVSKEYSKQNK